MLDLKFAIYHRAASLPSWASWVDVCSIGWRAIERPDQALFKHSRHTNCISKSAILLTSDLCACIHLKKNCVTKEAIVLQKVVRTTCWDFKPVKKSYGLVHCSVENAAQPLWKSHAIACLKKKKKATFLFGTFVMLFLAPLSVLFIIKTLEDERYVVTTAYKLAVFEILRDFLYCSSTLPLHIQFTNYMIHWNTAVMIMALLSLIAFSLIIIQLIPHI